MFFHDFYQICLSFLVSLLHMWGQIYDVLNFTITIPEFDPLVLRILPFLQGFSGYSCSVFFAIFGGGLLIYFGVRLVKFFLDALPFV